MAIYGKSPGDWARWTKDFDELERMRRDYEKATYGPLRKPVLKMHEPPHDNYDKWKEWFDWASRTPNWKDGTAKYYGISKEWRGITRAASLGCDCYNCEDNRRRFEEYVKPNSMPAPPDKYASLPIAVTLLLEEIGDRKTRIGSSTDVSVSTELWAALGAILRVGNFDTRTYFTVNGEELASAYFQDEVLYLFVGPRFDAECFAVKEDPAQEEPARWVD